MINEEIRAKQVRLVGEGEPQILDTKIALQKAVEQGLDLICISDKGDIPVVKIEDYQHFCYEQKKKQKENKKKAKSKSQETKEMQLSDTIAEHDIKVKAKKVDKILKDGDKVKIRIKFKSRRLQLIDMAVSRINSLLDSLEEPYRFDTEIKTTNGEVYTVIAPKK